MAVTPTGSVDIPQEEFGGLITEISAADVPMGASPFCQDVEFALGQWLSRAGLTAQFATQYAGGVKVNYLRTFTLPNTNDELLTLDSAGNFYIEDTTNNPGVLTVVGAITKNSFCNSTTQFGREWLAFNDGVWGFDAPRQWDGTFLDRVSQDAPGIAPAPADEIISVALAGGIGGIAIPAASAVTSASQAGNIVTISPRVSQVGDMINVAGVGAGYDGQWTIIAAFPTGQTYAANTSGLAPVGAGGTVQVMRATVTTLAAFPATAGNNVVFAGVGVAAWNTTFVIEFVTSPTVFTVIVPLALIGTAASGGGTTTTAGNITAGIHKVVQIFLTREGYLTAPSPIAQWTASGGKRVTVGNLAIGPANVIARWIAFTATGGAFFFVIPIPTTGSTTGTVVLDNTSTTATFDFADATLLNGFSIDSPGNNLFNLVVLGPAAGVISYSQRMFWWGQRNKIQNLLNMGFDGGFDPTNIFPLGWTISAVTGGGGSRVTPSSITGFAYRITSGAVGATHYGSIEQPAFRDGFNVAILQPNTAYTMRFNVIVGAVINPGGNLVFELFSPTSGVLANATFSLNTPVSNVPGYFAVNFSAATPAVIPADTILRFYVIGSTNTATVTLDELEILPTNQPFISTFLQGSYIANPESFDNVTGNIGVSQLDGQSIRACFKLRDNLYVVKDSSIYVTQDNGTTEPSGWTVSTVSTKIGTCSIRGVAVAEEYAFIVSQLGVYMFNGGEPTRVNQEIKPVSDLGQGWDSINWRFGSTIWTEIDISNRRLLIGAPVGESSEPNQIFVMNYRELDESYAVASNKAVHLSYTGKMVSWDMSRKWNQWNIRANCGAIVRRQNLSLQVWLGNNAGTGKAYYLDPAATSDDGVAINWQYGTSFFINREMEQQLQLGCGRKLYTYMRLFGKGAGVLSTTITADSLTSPRTKALAARNIPANPGFDIELPINFTGDRSGFTFSGDGQLTTNFSMSKMVVSMKPDPWAPVRGLV